MPELHRTAVLSFTFEHSEKGLLSNYFLAEPPKVMQRR